MPLVTSVDPERFNPLTLARALKRELGHLRPGEPKAWMEMNQRDQLRWIDEARSILDRLAANGVIGYENP